MTDEQANAFVDEAFEKGWQILVHCNGDAAVDQFIRAVRLATAKYGPGDRRPVMIHAQTVREDQLDAMKELGIIPSFFGMHTYYWGTGIAIRCWAPSGPRASRPPRRRSRGDSRSPSTTTPR